MSAAHAAVALAGLSLAMSTAALVSCGLLAKKVHAQAPRARPVPRLDLSAVGGGSGEGGEVEDGGGGQDGSWAESVGECEGEVGEDWEEGEWEEDDDKENRPPDSDWCKYRMSDGSFHHGPVGKSW